MKDRASLAAAKPPGASGRGPRGRRSATRAGVPGEGAAEDGRRVPRGGPLCPTALALALLAGCGRGPASPVAPVAPPEGDLAPAIVEVHPPARSRGVPYDTDIWARFAVPLEAATVNGRTVFLKLDTARIPATVTYHEAAHTIRLAPDVPLALLRTYTVEIAPGVAVVGGGSLARTSFWQFRTNGLRRLEGPLPADGAVGESPQVALRWTGTEPTAGTIVYEVYAGDSAEVAARAQPAIGLVSVPAFLPRTRWGWSVRRHWAVTAANLTTGERLAGPVWRFDTLPATTPVDSLVVPAADWGYYSSTLNRVVCMAVSITCGPNAHDGIRWQLPRGDLKLARAKLVANVTNFPGEDFTPLRLHLAGLVTPWAPCDIGPSWPALDTRGELANGVQSGITQRVTFEGDALTAYLEAGARFGYGHGLSFRSVRDVLYASPATLFEGFAPALTLYYYRTAPAPAAHGLSVR